MGEYSVALVEDNKDIADMLPRPYSLHGHGSTDPEFYKITETRDDLSNDPAKALEQLESNHDVIVVDNGLPWDFEGVELFYEAADRDLDTEIILYTDTLDYSKNNFDYDRVENIKEQNDNLHYIQKDREELAELLDEALDGESPQTPQT